MRPIILVLLGCFSISGQTSPETTAPLKHCKNHPSVMGPCFTFRGKLQNWNGTPTMRISRFGTSGILGVSDGMALPDYWQIPKNVSDMLTSFDTTVVGEFEFCPFTADEPGVMQLGCVESASNLMASEREKK